MPIYKRKGIYYLDVYRGGKRIRKSFGKGVSRQQAKQYESAHYTRVANNKVGQQYLDDALAYWLDGDARSLKSYKKFLDHAKHVAPYTKDVLLINAHIASEKYKGDHRARLKPATINRRIALIRRVCNLAFKEWGWIDVPIGQRIKLLPEHNQRTVFLQPGEVKQLASACRHPEVKKMIMFAAYSGLRLSELLLLDKKHYRHGVISLPVETKAEKPRTVPIPKQIQSIAKTLPFKATYNQVQVFFRQARKAAKMEHVRFHDLRHTFASLLLGAGASLSAVMELMGHSTVAVTKDLYGHLEKKHLQQAIKLLEKRIG